MIIFHYSFSFYHTGSRYLGLICYNFTNQPLDECCDDASVFIADPLKTGNGPGGLKILCAAAMRCKSKNNLAGLLDIDTINGVKRLMLCDQEIFNSTGNNSETTTDVVGETIISCLNASGISDAPSKPRLSFLTLLGSVYVSNTIIVECGGSKNSNGTNKQIICYKKNQNEKKSSFFKRLWESMQNLKPILIPSYEYYQHVSEGDLLVILGGELEVADVALVAEINNNLLSVSNDVGEKEDKQDDIIMESSSNGSILLTNVRSNQETMESVTIGKSTLYTASTNTGDILTSLTDLVGKSLQKED